MLVLALGAYFKPCAVSANEMVVKIRSKQSNVDVSHDYFVSLLKLALEKTQDEYGLAKVVITDYNPSQGRALRDLIKSQDINLDWAGTSREREERLRPIRIPLIGGLLGYRVPVIHKDSIAEFSRIRTLSDLKAFTAIQGTHWPDADILEDAGLKVHRVPSFDLMYNMLGHGRVDYFPRGLNEVYAEEAKISAFGLIAFDSLIISYPLPMYFFTNKQNEKLAVRIEKGLRKAIEDGSFRHHMENHPVTARLFPLSQYDNATFIPIKNNDLPKKTPLHDSTLWITIGDTPHR